MLLEFSEELNREKLKIIYYGAESTEYGTLYSAVQYCTVLLKPHAGTSLTTVLCCI